MPEIFTISLGGMTISLIPDRLQGFYDQKRRAVDFQSTASPEISLQIHCGSFPELGPKQVVFNTGVAWQLYQVNENWVFNTYPLNQNLYLLGVFPADFRSGDIYTSANGNGSERYYFPLVSPMGELFMMNLLGTGLGILFHAAGVIDHGKGYLFTGHGGAGKTTIAQLWQGIQGVQVVNDNKVIVRKVGGEYRFYGTPWSGEGSAALPDSAPLERVFILKQSDHNYVRPIQPAKAASELFVRGFLPLWDAEKITFTLEFLDDLCQSVPCAELGFLPEQGIVNFIRDLP